MMYIGLDIGTSGTKAALVDKSGVVRKEKKIPYRFVKSASGYRELDMEQVWNAVTVCLAALGSSEPACAITVSALGEAIVLVDAEGQVLGHGITGTDSRGTAELEQLKEQIGAAKLTEITGLNISHIYSLNKLLWLKNHRPEIFEKVHHIFTFQDYIIYRLTGTAVIDYSMASRTMLFDIHEYQWSEFMLKAAGIGRSLLSMPVPAGTKAGKLRAGAAKQLGLSRHIMVIAGTHDHICNAIGAGVYRPGWCANTVGTTEGFTAVLEKEQVSSRIAGQYQISCEPFVKPGTFNTVAWNHTSGILLNWYLKQFAREYTGAAGHSYQEFHKKLPAVPTDLLVLPYFSGAATPYMDHDAKGAIIGLTLDTTREEIYRAFLEGVNFEMQLILECLLQSDIKITQIIATGGALSEELLQIKADILGREIGTVAVTQTGVLGGAMIGAVAMEEYQDMEEGIAQMVRFGRTYEPNWHNHEQYQQKMTLYRELYGQLKEINRQLSRDKS